MKPEYKLLDRIQSPADLKTLSVDELPQLCHEIRGYLLDVLSKTPGHLAASLGVVELTVALHYVFEAPEDKLIWDVGHQSYAHKLLTGRRETFGTLRQWGGLGGFTHPSESLYDAFISGHASNSISAALGYAVSNQLEGKAGKVVAIIGDGAMTGGLAFEGLNNAASQPNNLLIILNDNHISIDPITGGLSKYLVDITTSRMYNRVRNKGYQKLKRMNLINESRRKNLLKFNNSIKALVNDERNIFESFSIRYFGPTDGHDVHQLVERLEVIKDFEGPKLLHIKTIKGKGYKPAEKSAVEWHAPGKFDRKTGLRIIPPMQPDHPMKFQDIFGQTLLELADMDERVVGITPAMISGSSFGYMMDKYPERVFDVGIAEGHAVTYSAGLAMGGSIPFCNIYSSFLQRAYDQVIHDVAMQRAPVIMCLDRAGLVGNDGATHQGVYDIAYLRTIPGLVVMSPYDERDLRQMMYTAYKHHTEGPFVIRFPRGEGSNPDWRVPFEEIELGRSRTLTEGEDVVFVSYGPVGGIVSDAVTVLKDRGHRVGHVDLRFVKPLDTAMLDRIAEDYKHIITVEDGSLNGGVGSAILEYYSDVGRQIPLMRVGVPDEFIRHGSVEIQYAYVGLDRDTLVRKAERIIERLR